MEDKISNNEFTNSDTPFAGSMDKTSFRGIWVGGETKTWAVRYALIGVIVGMILGVGAAIYMNDSSAVPERFVFILFLVLFFFSFFGAFSGVLVGLGTPKYKSDPEQGYWMSWGRFNDTKNNCK